MRVMIYGRVSRDEAGLGRSVTDQIGACREWAAREGWEVIGEVEETGSASRYAHKQRDEWTDVLKAIESRKMDALLTWEFSRATRDLEAFTQLRDACARNDVLWGYGGHIHDLSDRSARFRTGLDALLAEDEAARTSERVRRAVESNIAKGRPHGKNTYGLHRVYNPQTRELMRIEETPEQASVVREAASRVLAGESSYSVAKSFNARSIPTRRPKFEGHNARLGWTATLVAQMLSMPVYAGYRTHKGKIVGDGDWPRILDRETWEQLQSTLRQRWKPNPQIRTRKYLLSGLAFCGLQACGAPMTKTNQTANYRRNSDGTHRRYPVYACTRSGHTSRKVSQLDAYVTEVVIERLSRPDVVATIGDAREDNRAERDRLSAEIRSYQEYLDKVRTRAAAEQSMDLLFDQEARIRPLIDDAKARLTELVDVNNVVLNLAMENDVRSAWDGMDLKERRDVIYSLLVLYVYPKRKRGARTFDPAEVEVVWKS